MTNRPECIVCQSQNMKLHFYPPNRFNGKVFSYYNCLECGSLSIFPLPTENDFKQIYGENDHSYLNDLDEDEKLNTVVGYPKFTYHKYQLDFFKGAMPLLKGKKLLDYACGSGFYMAYAKKLGFDPIGIEYSNDFAKLLRQKTNLEIYGFKSFKEEFQHQQFDIIHLGHVLEHLTNPKQLFSELKPFIHNDTIFIIDGPLENNACLSRFVINLGSKIKKRSFNEYEPQHLSFTNYHSQLHFFEALNLKPIKYKVVEQYWPLPEKPNLSSPSETARYLLARSSITISSLFEKQGNVFHYIGKFQN